MALAADSVVTKTIDLSSDETQILELPVVAYPPFKLRSSLIDKDPVIWVHLLEEYIYLFKFLVVLTTSKKYRNVKLSPKSTQQLHYFMKVYLFETSEETSRIFSLGAINPDIVKYTKMLKVIVFQFIRCYNLVNLRLSGESVWHFIKIYSRLAHINKNGNQSVVTLNLVRDLVQGQVKSKLNSKSDDISMIKPLHTHLNALIGGGKFHKQDLETLAITLGSRYQSGASSGSNVNASSSKRSFSETFVNKDWTDILENLYNGGTGLHAQICFHIAVVSLTSLSASSIGRLVQNQLKHRTKSQLVGMNPLVARVLLSQQLKEVIPGLEDELKFLDSKPKVEAKKNSVNPEHIRMLQEFFPQLSDGKAKTLLLDTNHNPEIATHKLLEDPSLVDSLKEWEAPKSRSIYDPKTFDPTKITFGKKAKPRVEKASQEFNERTLTSALRLLYDSDEDEPDDTYEDQEETTPSALSLNIKTSKAVSLDDDDDEDKPENIDKIEKILFLRFKRSPDDLQRSARKTRQRQELKSETNWTDEQIEGWARMLVKTPRLFKLLESRYMVFNNQGLKPSTAYRKPRAVEVSDSEEPSTRSSSNASQRSNTPNRARKEQHKASVGNHNRKRGNDRKLAKEL